MTIAELNSVFVRLGVGDYDDAIDIVLKSLVRASGPALPGHLTERLHCLPHLRDFNSSLLLTGPE